MPETIGLDIGSHSIKLVALKMTPKGPFLTHAGIKQIPYGKEKEDLNLISDSVKALFREVGLKPGKVSLTVSGSGVNISRITIPSMPKAELKEAVRWEVKDHLPFPIESAQTDIHILREFVEENVKKLDLIAVICPNPLIERTLTIAERAGLKCHHLDSGPFALWNALLARDQADQEEGVVLVDLGAEKTGVHFFKSGVLQFSREITPAGADITQAITEGLDSGEELSLLYEEAEKIKQEMGIPLKDSSEGRDGKSIPISKLSFLVRPVTERLVSEIRRSLDYYRNQFNVDRIDRLLLTGGGAKLKNLVPHLHEELGIPVEAFNPLGTLPFDPKKIDSSFLDEMGLAFTGAMGLAGPQRKRIELLPTREPFWSKAQMEKTVPVFSSLVLLIFFLATIWHLNGQATHLQKEQDAKREKVKALETLQTRLQYLKGKETEMKQDLSFIPLSLRVPVSFQEIIASVSHTVPENVTITLLSVQPKKEAPKGEPQRDGEKELQVAGLAFGSDQQCLMALARIMDGLEKSPRLKNAKLVSAAEHKSYNQPGAEFEVACDVESDRPPFAEDSRGD